MKSHIFRPIAAGDIEAVYGRYELARPGLGDEFLVEAGRTVDAVVAFPEAYPVVHRDVRRALIRSFPYGLLYRILDELPSGYGRFLSRP